MNVFHIIRINILSMYIHGNVPIIAYFYMTSISCIINDNYTFITHLSMYQIIKYFSLINSTNS